MQRVFPCLLILLLSGGRLTAQCLPDQVQEQWNGGTSERNLPGYYEWQSFTAGSTGALCGIDVLFCNINVPVVGTGTLKVFTGEGLGGTLLAPQAVNVDGSATALNLPFWANWALEVPPNVEAGSIYTLQFIPTQGGGLPDPYLIQITLPGLYPGGHCFNLGTDGDIGFRTHVDAAALSVERAVAAPAMQVYPTLATDRITVLTSVNSADVALINSSGQVVRRSRVSAPMMDLDVADLPAGPYWVRMVSDGGAVVARVMKL